MKHVVRLTEEELNRVITEAITKKMENGMAFPVDISSIDVNDLKSCYRDLRLTPIPTFFDNPLYGACVIKEAVGDIMPPDDVVNSIIQKYQYNPKLISKREAFRNIYIYVIVAVIGQNDKLIIEDMSKMGYYVGVYGKAEEIDGMTFRVIQFEPTSQKLDDITEEIKSKYKHLFHWTPVYNIPNIQKEGLIPSHKNELFNYPPRTYLMESDCDDYKIIGLGQQLCFANNNPLNNGKYALLKVNLENIEDSVRFYYDSNSEIGIFTEQKISKDKIEKVKIVQFVKGIKK